jgi:hypothetical protein
MGVARLTDQRSVQFGWDSANGLVTIIGAQDWMIASIFYHIMQALI